MIVVLVIAIGITVTLIIMRDRSKKNQQPAEPYRAAQNTERATTEREQPVSAAANNYQN